MIMILYYDVGKINISLEDFFQCRFKYCLALYVDYGMGIVEVESNKLC